MGSQLHDLRRLLLPWLRASVRLQLGAACWLHLGTWRGGPCRFGLVALGQLCDLGRPQRPAHRCHPVAAGMYQWRTW